MKYSIVLSMLAAFLLTGCASTHYERRGGYQGSPQQPPMAVRNVIDMSKSGVDDSIIMVQIRATHARFDLSSSDIITLTKAGVSKQVITAMVQSGEEGESTSGEYGYSPYYYGYPSIYFNYWRPLGGYYRFPYFRHYSYGFHRGGGFRFGGGRSFGGGRK